MKHLIIFFIIILGFILIKCLPTEPFSNTNVPSDYIHPLAIINTSTVSGGGRGVFANKNYKKDDIVEICPCIKTEMDMVNGKIRDYIFGYDEKMALVALGYCSMYNHSDTPNVAYLSLDDEKMQITAIKNIKKGDEMFFSYGEDYWSSRTEYLNKK